MKEFFAKKNIIFGGESVITPSIISLLRALIVNVHNDVFITKAGGIFWYT